MKLTTHFQLVLWSKLCGSIHQLPHTCSWRSALLVNHRDNLIPAQLDHNQTTIYAFALAYNLTTTYSLVSWHVCKILISDDSKFLFSFSFRRQSNLSGHGEPRYNPCDKLQPLIDHADTVVWHCYGPLQQLSIDDSLVGRRNHIQPEIISIIRE
jgi:hypothetical protein